MKEQNIKVETPEGLGELIGVGQQWVIALPWGDYRFAGSREEALKHTDALIEQFRKGSVNDE